MEPRTERLDQCLDKWLVLVPQLPWYSSKDDMQVVCNSNGNAAVSKFVDQPQDVRMEIKTVGEKENEGTSNT